MANKKRILIVMAVIFAIISIIATKMFSNKVKQTSARVCFEQKCFQAEIANDEAVRQKGLMDRTSLEQDKGMLFVFDKEDKHSFWMKNTKIPLDVIWMDKEGKIVDIQTLTPCASDSCPSFVPESNAQFVLEINAGLSKESNLKIGSTALLR